MTNKDICPAPRIPIATYRLQFHAGFGFRDATAILPYLRDLGITEVYASPYLKARPGSLHGYDIVAHDCLNPEVGSAAEYEEFTSLLQELNMGQLLDIVPNHMCVESKDNLWWQDLLENGPSSLHAHTFDIHWNPVKKQLKDRVLIPVLGDQYGNVLENGELILSFAAGAFILHYYEHEFPILPKSYEHILSHRLEDLQEQIGNDSLPFQELLSIMTALQHLPVYTEIDPDLVVERYREKEVIKRRLALLYSDYPAIAAFIDDNIRLFNGQLGSPESFDLLDRLLAEQVYRISHWRVATEEINYRRFFDINALGAIRVEDEAVFTETHHFLLALVAAGKVTGFRVDHVDGLYDPAAYLHRLQAKCLGALQQSPPETSSTEEFNLPPESAACRSFYIIGEKILIPDERLPQNWPLHGTTGYAFLNCLNNIFIDSHNGRKVDLIYRRFIRNNLNYPEVVTEAKRLVMQVSMSSEINMLSDFLNTISERNRHTRDFTLNSLTKALVEVIAFFPVYRTYIGSKNISDDDRQKIEQALAKARRRNPAIGASIFDFLHDVLLLRCPTGADQEDLQLRLDFVMRFQQCTGPVMAKGVEDTASYLYNRLISLNEVGGAPDHFGCSVASFHQYNMDCLATYPHAMNATSTHDTKRSADVRARINVLSEIPHIWHKALTSWGQLNRKLRPDTNGLQAPSRNEEYLLYQTLLGAWPHDFSPDQEFSNFVQRIKDYMTKALREAKVHSSWMNPDSVYEEAVASFIDTILAAGDTPFIRSFLGLADYVSRLGMFNSLSQTLLKITAPGLPDCFQGSELWDLSLVDPDNRRPVDFAKRQQILQDLLHKDQQLGPAAICADLLEHMEDGSIKFFLTWKALNFRRNNRAIFEQGTYLPLTVTGKHAESVIAFSRTIKEQKIIVVVPRFLSRLIRDGMTNPLGRPVWGDTAINLLDSDAELSYFNIFTGETHRQKTTTERGLYLGDMLQHFPVALLEWRL